MMKRIYIIILLLYCWVSFLPAQDICSPVREGYLSMSDEKKKLTVADLLHKFEEASGEEFANDKAILG